MKTALTIILTIIVLFLIFSWFSGGSVAYNKGYHANDERLQQSQQAADEAWANLKESFWGK